MTDDELKSLIDALRNENVLTRKENLAAHSETRHDFRETADRLTAENRHYFDVATEATMHAIGLIAEKVTQLDVKLDRTAANLDEKIERTASETQSMIRFSHADLDRRMRTLEESVAELQTRVERLEGSTH